MARNEQLIRQHKLLYILEGSRYGLRLDELTHQLKEDAGLSRLSDRTVRRDLEALQLAGFDLDSEQTPRGTVWKLGPGLRNIPKVEASITELVGLSVIRDLTTPFTGTIYWQGIESLWQKLRQSLPESLWRHFDKLRRHMIVLGVLPKSYDRHQGKLRVLNSAIEKHQVVSLVYRRAGSPQATAREVHPLLIVIYNANLYLIAQDPRYTGDEGIRKYKIDRCRKVEALDRYFQPPDDFDPQQHFENSLGVYTAERAHRFVIRLANEVVDWVEETPWHMQQTIDRDSEGGALLTIPSAYEEEILPKVMSLGPLAEVLEPAECRERIEQRFAECLALYRQPTSG